MRNLIVDQKRASDSVAIRGTTSHEWAKDWWCSVVRQCNSIT